MTSIQRQTTLASGCYCPLIPALDDGGNFSSDACRSIVEYVVGSGVNGIVIDNVSHSLTETDHSCFARTVVDQAAGRVTVLAAVRSLKPWEAEHQLAELEAAGIDAAIVPLPQRIQRSEGLHVYIGGILAPPGLSVVLDNTKSRWPTQAIAKLIERFPERIAGVSCSAEPANELAELRRLRDGILILAGTVHERKRCATAGANACIDPYLNLTTREGVEAYAGDQDKQHYCLSIHQALASATDKIATIRQLMVALGLPAGCTSNNSDDFQRVRTCVARGGRLVAGDAGRKVADPVAVVEKVHLLEPGCIEKATESGSSDFQSTTIWRGGREGYHYNHHPSITFFEDRYFASWSSGLLNEDSPGQLIRVAQSCDGEDWTDGESVVPSPTGPLRWTSGGFWRRGNDLNLLVQHCTRARYVDGESRPCECWENPHAKLLRWTGQTWMNASTLLEDFYPNEAPRQLPNGNWMMTGVNSLHDAVVAIGGVAGTDDWHVHIVAKRTDGFKLTEPSWFVAGDKLRLFLRDDGGSKRVWLSESMDMGRTWTTPIASDFTDAQAKFFALPLPDGQVAIVTNPSAGDIKRKLMGIVLSRDGEFFDRFVELRHDPNTSARMVGMHKAPGFQYPNAVVANSQLMVINSVNKEDIEVHAIPLSALH